MDRNNRFKRSRSKNEIKLDRLIRPRMLSRTNLILSSQEVNTFYSSRLYPVIANRPLKKQNSILGQVQEETSIIQFPYNSQYKYSLNRTYSVKKIPINSHLVLDAPGVHNDESIMHVDVCSEKIVAVLLGRSCYLYNLNTKEISEIAQTKQGYFLSGVRFSDCGNYISIGSSNGKVVIYDMKQKKIVRCLNRELGGRKVTSLAWSSSILSNGNSMGNIFMGDVRMKSFLIRNIEAHSRGDVIGLEFNNAGNVLASSGRDCAVKIWGLRRNKVSVEFNKQLSPVKAISFNPIRDNMIATGGIKDKKMYFWNFRNGKIINSISTESYITGIDFYNNKVISSHGEPENCMRLWNYPSFSKGSDFVGHDRKILSMKLKDDVLVSISSDETLRFWNINKKGNDSSKKSIFEELGFSKSAKIR